MLFNPGRPALLANIATQLLLSRLDVCDMSSHGHECAGFDAICMRGVAVRVPYYIQYYALAVTATVERSGSSDYECGAVVSAARDWVLWVAPVAKCE